MRELVKRGHADWDNLIGEELILRWYDGFSDIPYWFEGIFEGTAVIAGDSRHPRYFILLDVGGPSVWEDEDVMIWVKE